MNLIVIGQIVVAIILTVLILMQNQGTGLGASWGGSGESYHTKRGVEKVVFVSTIVLAVLFTLLSILALL